MAPLGVFVNLSLTLFLPLETWLRLVIWLAVGLVIYFSYSRRHSLLTQHLLHEIQMPRDEETGSSWTRKWSGSEGEGRQRMKDEGVTSKTDRPSFFAPSRRQNRSDRNSG